MRQSYSSQNISPRRTNPCKSLSLSLLFQPTPMTTTTACRTRTRTRTPRRTSTTRCRSTPRSTPTSTQERKKDNKSLINPQGLFNYILEEHPRNWIANNVILWLCLKSFPNKQYLSFKPFWGMFMCLKTASLFRMNGRMFFCLWLNAL